MEQSDWSEFTTRVHFYKPKSIIYIPISETMIVHHLNLRMVTAISLSANSTDYKYLIALLLSREQTNCTHVRFRDRHGVNNIFSARKTVLPTNTSAEYEQKSKLSATTDFNE